MATSAYSMEKLSQDWAKGGSGSQYVLLFKKNEKGEISFTGSSLKENRSSSHKDISTNVNKIDFNTKETTESKLTQQAKPLKRRYQDEQKMLATSKKVSPLTEEDIRAKKRIRLDLSNSLVSSSKHKESYSHDEDENEKEFLYLVKQYQKIHNDKYANVYREVDALFRHQDLTAEVKGWVSLLKAEMISNGHGTVQDSQLASELIIQTLNNEDALSADLKSTLYSCLFLQKGGIYTDGSLGRFGFAHFHTMKILPTSDESSMENLFEGDDSSLYDSSDD
jgi:hypothetical protein